MRLPVIHELDSRDGESNKDARLTNVLSENDEGGVLAVVRPALSTIATATGNGNGVTEFDGVLISVFGTVLGYGETPSTIGSVVSGKYDFTQSPL